MFLVKIIKSKTTSQLENELNSFLEKLEDSQVSTMKIDYLIEKSEIKFASESGTDYIAILRYKVKDEPLIPSNSNEINAMFNEIK